MADVVGGWVQSISGAGGLGGTIVINASPLQFANTVANPTISQATTPNANAQPMILQPETSSNANGSPGDLQVILGNPSGSGNYSAIRQFYGNTGVETFRVAPAQNSTSFHSIWMIPITFSATTPGNNNHVLGVQGNGVTMLNGGVSGAVVLDSTGALTRSTRYDTNGWYFFGGGISTDFGGGTGVIAVAKATTAPTAAPANAGTHIVWSDTTDLGLHDWPHGGVKTTLASGATATCLDDLAIAQITTANATQTTCLTYAVASNQSGVFMAVVTARNTSTNHAAATVIMFGAENVAGTVAIDGTAQNILTVANGSNAAMNTVSVAVSGSTSNIIVQVTGIAATNIQWTVKLYALVA